MKNDYLNIPLMGKIYVAPNFNLQIGPQIGFLLNAKFKGKDGGVNVSFDAKEMYKKTDFGINAGLEYESETGVSLTARYNLGLTNVVDIAEVDSKNSALQLTLGYLFKSK